VRLFACVAHRKGENRKEIDHLDHVNKEDVLQEKIEVGCEKDL
jgi:hypothetical protein